MKLFKPLSITLVTTILSMGIAHGQMDAPAHSVRLHEVGWTLKPRIIPKVNTATTDSTDPYWQRAMHEVDRSPQDIKEQARREESEGAVLPKLIRGNPREKLLALTFDDGPHPQYTERLLNLLKAEDVKATFFVVGRMVEQHPRMLREIVANGNEVGNHTFSHVTLTKVPANVVRAEYQACNAIVRDVSGYQMHVCRPPGGDYNRNVIRAASEQGLTTVLWTDDPGDYANPGTHVIETKTLHRLSNGGIILLHDGIQETLDVLPQIIGYARDHGYRFVTIDELMDSKTASRTLANAGLTRKRLTTNKP